jgi:hypothetical protein
MEINYDLILKYLVPNKIEENQFVSKKNIMIFSDIFPTNFKELLGDKFYKIGVTQMVDNMNISFFSSFLTLMADNYMSLMESEEMTQINKLINELIDDINSNKIPNSLKEIVKGALKKYIKDKEICIWLLEMLSHKLMINVLIFDFKSEEIYTIYPQDIMNPWRPFLLFAKNNYNWEPIRNQEKKLFSYNDAVIKKILTNSNIEIKYYDGNIIKKEYILVDNINEIINDEFGNKNEDNKISSNESDESSTNNENTFISAKDVNITQKITQQEEKINKSKLIKMTKEELINYMKSVNLKFNTKSTKKDLIELVLQ